MSENQERTTEPAVNPQELATRVRAKREASKLSVRGAAAALGMSASTISRVETGKHLPERDHLLTLAQWSGMSLDSSGITGPQQRPVHSDDAETMEAIELHLRADKDLHPDDADILVGLVKGAYDRMSKRTHGS